MTKLDKLKADILLLSNEKARRSLHTLVSKGMLSEALTFAIAADTYNECPYEAAILDNLIELLK